MCAELVRSGAPFLSEPGRGAGASRLVRARYNLFRVELARHQVFGPEHQPTRRCIHRRDPSAQSMLIKQCLKHILQVAQDGNDHPVWNFLGPDLEQKRQAHATASFFGAISAIQAVATLSASLRTRPITPTRSVTLIAPRESNKLNTCEHLST